MMFVTDSVVIGWTAKISAAISATAQRRVSAHASAYTSAALSQCRIMLTT